CVILCLLTNPKPINIICQLFTDPEVQRQFPEDYSDQEVLQTLTKFCFPFYVDSLTVSQVGQNFTFVLTDIDSKQRFGFCRLSSGAKSCFCILR
uniref:DENN domain containing 1A n=1 Tax=Ovis aries TaxID=9940 RepID=A0AC11EBH7_SHEEP